MRSLYSRNTWPKNCAERPSTSTNTTEKPSMYMSEFASIMPLSFLEPSSSVSSSKDMPVTKDMYEGTRGKTQGEIKDMNPPPKATSILLMNASSMKVS